ncbi:exopolysaccharide biosynthesis polyprenyl glycosylphosphotransferase [Chryseobacterium sp. Leaf394]|uniref:exopolysaccharide biosynthesis polyprenyl glycosylphosphotransferase n=1 Tax=Chryseobacterium sp. Leaf394 TaxID=1736361 RepID=UPI001F521BCF|nr:exopolysaccharide biosynthesis polyprenyl glycosylphosphotransferase [Chryseobacterium sp. Leaf394]
MIIVLLDLLVLASVFIFFYAIRTDVIHNADLWYENSFPLLLLISFWLLLSGRTKIYNIPRNLTYTLFTERIIAQFVLFVIGLVLIRKVSNNQFFGSELAWLSLYLFIFVMISKSMIYFGIKYLRSRGVNNRNIMFLEENASTEVLKNFLEERRDYGYRIFDYSPLLSTHSLTAFWKEKGIHTIFIPTQNSIDKKTEEEIFRLAEKSKVNVTMVPSISQNEFFLYDLEYIKTQPVLKQTKYPLDYFSNFILKRTFDIIFSVFVLLFICSWMFPLIAIFIKLSSKGPVFFIQKRYGFHERVFCCLKFRTMIVNADSATKTTEMNDKRITKTGRFLRKTSLDELPQFINVLKGEMSVVGPRPHMLAVDDHYKQKIGRYSLRSMVNPGITGIAQVNGLRGDDGNVEVEMNKRVLADAFYVRNWSFVLDLVIILKTVFLMFRGDKKAG